VLVSIPLRSHPVDTTRAGGELGTEVGKPELTAGFGTAFGLRIPIPPSFEPKTGVRGSVLGGIGATWLNDGEDATMLYSAGGGGEIEF
jgi:hypothetical protein